MQRKIRRQTLAFGRGLHDLHYRSNESSEDIHDSHKHIPSVISPNSTLLHSTLSSSRRSEPEIKQPCRDFDTESVASSVSTSVKKGPNFRKINAAKVRIHSLRNKINKTNDINTITNMMAEVLTLEDEILREKTKGYKLLESKKKSIEDKIQKMARELYKLEDELSIVDLELKQKTEKAREELAQKIKILEIEYNAVSEKLEKMPR